ncbi:TlpA disulfide reductase family protein [Streptomyces sp. NPDC046931]|uniref:TlpA family protein disulfide reductase n=1 Tax=Streptomyces sp. NPDC046931 TaxID=3154806 RepID=UPI00340E1805
MKPTKAAALALALLMLSGCASAHLDDGQAPHTLHTYAPADRKAMPDLTGTAIDGRPIAVHDYRGNVLVINTWASWCGPCRAEASDLSAVHTAFHSRGVRVMGVDADASREVGASFARRHKVVYRSLHDPRSVELLRIPKGLVNPQAYPYTLVVDRQGRIAAARMGQISRSELTALIEPLLGSPSRPTAGRTGMSRTG